MATCPHNCRISHFTNEFFFPSTTLTILCMKQLTSSLRITSTCRRLLNSSHSSLYLSISSLVCLTFFFRTSKRDPWGMLVVIANYFGMFSYNGNKQTLNRITDSRKTAQTATRLSVNWASRRYQNGALLRTRINHLPAEVSCFQIKGAPKAFTMNICSNENWSYYVQSL